MNETAGPPQRRANVAASIWWRLSQHRYHPGDARLLPILGALARTAFLAGVRYADRRRKELR